MRVITLKQQTFMVPISPSYLLADISSINPHKDSEEAAASTLVSCLWGALPRGPGCSLCSPRGGGPQEDELHFGKSVGVDRGVQTRAGSLEQAKLGLTATPRRLGACAPRFWEGWVSGFHTTSSSRLATLSCCC